MMILILRIFMSLENDTIKEIYRLYFDKIYKFFYYKFLNQSISEDLTSDTFLSFVQNIKNGKKVENYKSYLYGIARNKYIEKLREKYKKQEINFSDIENFQPESIDEFVEQSEGETPEEKISKYIDMLPTSQKEVAKLRFLEKNSLNEICKKLDRDMNYVKTTQKRAIAKLKSLIECTP